MMTVSACLWLGLFPLLQFGTYSTITRDKWVIMLVLTGVSVLGAIGMAVFPAGSGASGRGKAARAGASPSRLLRYLPLWIALALTAWMALSCLASPYGESKWWIGGSQRREGLLSQLCYMGLFFMFSFARIRRRPLLLSASAGVLAFLVIVLLQRAGVNVFKLYPFGRSYRLNPEFQGTIGNIDMGTGYLCMMAALFLTELVRFRAEPGASAASILGYLLPLLAGLGAAVYLVLTMDVQFGMITLGVLALVTLLRFIPRRWRVPLLLLLVVLVLVVVWFWPGQGGGIWELHEILHGRPQLSFGSNRIAVWQYSLGLAGESLLLGGGSDTFEQRFNSYLKENGLAIPTAQGDLALPAYFDNPHNEYIAHLVNHGLPAMLLFIALFVSLVLHRPAETDPAETDPVRRLSPFTVAVICYAVQAFFSFSVCIVAPMLWVIAGLSLRNS